MNWVHDRNETARLGNRERPEFHGPFNHPACLALVADDEIFVAGGLTSACDVVVVENVALDPFDIYAREAGCSRKA